MKQNVQMPSASASASASAKAKALTMEEVQEYAQTKEKKGHAVDPEAINFSVWDYGGQEIFATLHHLFLSRYGIYPILFNILHLCENRTDRRLEEPFLKCTETRRVCRLTVLCLK